jgi:hypothetical protein
VKKSLPKVITKLTLKPKPPFKISLKHNTEDLIKEFKRQLKNQQDAINNMKVKDWLKNRENFKNRNVTDYNKAAKQARDDFRKKEMDIRINKYLQDNPNATIKEAQDAAEKSIQGQAALHNPDGIAGGKVDDITGMGDSNVNSSIGSQWKNGRADSIEEQVKKQYEIPPKTVDDIPDSEMMNVDLTTN